MNFLYPIGLLGLIGIPILIIVYIIKSKYTEQTVASTYLWTLSNRFLKKRRRMSRLVGLIALLLQLLAVAGISLAIAHPVVTLPGAAEDYFFILDASGSMSHEMGGTTRFERAKVKIADTIDSSANGSSYSLVLVSDTNTLLFDKTEDKDTALELLSGAKVGCSVGDVDAALSVAQEYFSENSSQRTYLVTDKQYSSAENLTVWDMSQNELNYAISDVSYALNEAEGKTTVIGNAVSYSGTAQLTVSLFVGEVDTAVSSIELTLPEGEPVPFTLVANTVSFDTLRVAIDASDSQAYDNSVTLYSIEAENAFDTLLVSDAPFFIKTALEAVGYADITVMSTEDYDAHTGYGLYIFDGFSPSTVPRDGTVWLINPTASVQGAGFSVQGEIELDSAAYLELSGSSQSLVKKLTEGIDGEGIAVIKYQKCGLNRNFSTLLSYKGNPMVFTGTTEYGNREVVFAFDLHSSNFPLVMDFITLTDNLLDYSFPTVVEKTLYRAGDEASVNVIAGCESIMIKAPSAEVSYVGIGGEVASFSLTEVGTYTVTMTVAGSPRVIKLYSELPEAEREVSVSLDAVALSGEPSQIGHDGFYDELTLLFIALAVIFCADWMVYCYDKYQLR